MLLQIDHSKLDAVNALYSEKALQFMAARDKLSAKSIRRAFSRLGGKCNDFECRVGSTLASAAPRNPDFTMTLEDVDLEAQLSCQIQKVLGIMAILINEQEGEIGCMNDLIDIISAMDRDFFAYASIEIEDVLEGRAPVTILMEAAQRYLEKTV